MYRFFWHVCSHERQNSSTFGTPKIGPGLFTPRHPQRCGRFRWTITLHQSHNCSATHQPKGVPATRIWQFEICTAHSHPCRWFIMIPMSVPFWTYHHAQTWNRVTLRKRIHRIYLPDPRSWQSSQWASHHLNHTELFESHVYWSKNHHFNKKDPEYKEITQDGACYMQKAWFTFSIPSQSLQSLLRHTHTFQAKNQDMQTKNPTIHDNFLAFTSSLENSKQPHPKWQEQCLRVDWGKGQQLVVDFRLSFQGSPQTQ